jgi:hypothetical protein
MQRLTAFLRKQSPDVDPLAPVELNRMARRVVDAIDGETGSRTAHSQRVARLYAVARDIQHAAESGCKEMTTYKIVAFLMAVLTRSYLPRLAPR